MIKLLVVDDEPGICDILKKTFSPIGFIVLTAYNGDEALALVTKEKPKIVLLDVKMLGLSGLEVLKQIKQLDRNIRVVMVTVMDDRQTREQAKELGADAFVAKPFISERLEEIIGKMIEGLIGA